MVEEAAKIPEMTAMMISRRHHPTRNDLNEKIDAAAQTAHESVYLHRVMSCRDQNIDMCLCQLFLW